MNFDVSLTVHLSITLYNGQLDAQIFNKYIYYNPLHVHVSSNILLILRRTNQAGHCLKVTSHETAMILLHTWVTQ